MLIVSACGSVFTVETVQIAPAAEGPPSLSATILLDAFVYSGVMPATADGSDGSTPATTTTSEGTS